MSSVSQDFLKPVVRRTVGVLDIPRVFFAPGKLFRRTEDVTAYTWPLILLLTAVTILGYATIETGLVDRLVDRQIEQQKAQMEKTQVDVVGRSQLRKNFEDLDKQAEFLKLITRLQAVVMAPIGMMVSIFAIAALFYGLVALGGKKPEWHTLMTIGVYAAYIDLLRGALALVLMVRGASLQVDLSLAALTRPFQWDMPMGSMVELAVRGLLSAFDPFSIWFWCVIAIGLKTTRQFSGWKLYTVCILCWMIGAGLRVLAAMAQGMQMAQT